MFSIRMYFSLSLIASFTIHAIGIFKWSQNVTRVELSSLRTILFAKMKNRGETALNIPSVSGFFVSTGAAYMLIHVTYKCCGFRFIKVLLVIK